MVACKGVEGPKGAGPSSHVLGYIFGQIQLDKITHARCEYSDPNLDCMRLGCEPGVAEFGPAPLEMPRPPTQGPKEIKHQKVVEAGNPVSVETREDLQLT